MHVSYELIVLITKILDEKSKLFLYQSSKLFYVLRWHNHICSMTTHEQLLKYNIYDKFYVDFYSSKWYHKVLTKRVSIASDYVMLSSFRFHENTETITFGNYLQNTIHVNIPHIPKIKKLVILLMSGRSYFFNYNEDLANVEILIFRVNRRSVENMCTFEIRSFPCNVKKIYFVQKNTDLDDIVFHSNDKVIMSDFPSSLEYLHVSIVSVIKYIVSHKMPVHITSLSIVVPVIFNYALTCHNIQNLPDKLINLRIGPYFENDAVELLPNTIESLIVSSNQNILKFPTNLKRLIVTLDNLCKINHLPALDHCEFFANMDINDRHCESIVTLHLFDDDLQNTNPDHFPKLENVIIHTTHCPDDCVFDIMKLKIFILICHKPSLPDTDSIIYPEWIHQYVFEQEGNRLRYIRLVNGILKTLSFKFYIDLPRVIKFYDVGTITIQTSASNTYEFPDNTKNIFFNKEYPDCHAVVKNKLKLPQKLKMFVFYSKNHLLEFNTNLPFLEYVNGNRLVKARHIYLHENF